MECCSDVSCLCFPVNKEESIECKHKGITMTQLEKSSDKQYCKLDVVRYCLV